MIKPSGRITAECDGCKRHVIEYDWPTGDRFGDCAPPQGWAEISGWIEGPNGPIKALLNRHLCSFCLTDTNVGQTLQACGLHVATLNPLPETPAVFRPGHAPR